MTTRKTKTLLALGVAAGGALALASPAAAEVDGPCTGTVDGRDVAPLSAGDPGDSIEVDADAVVSVGATSAETIDSYAVEMEFAGFSWEVASDTVDGTSWSRDVEVADYSRFGVGLYKVRAVSSGATPGVGAVLVKVTGKSPLTTPAGIGGAVLTGAGALGVALSARKAVVA